MNEINAMFLYQITFFSLFPYVFDHVFSHPKMWAAQQVESYGMNKGPLGGSSSFLGM